MDYTIGLPRDARLEGQSPVVIIGPNGSGKTRQARELTTVGETPMEFVNALRNTRVSTSLPAMGYDDARNNFVSQRVQARNQHWEITTDFDFLLSQLLADAAMKATEYVRAVRKDDSFRHRELPEESALSKLEEMWSKLFPGRELDWRDWKPVVRNDTTGDVAEYTGFQMSDGEKAALYLAGRVFSADAGVMVIDEPETHLHSLLAIRLWNLLEAARPDVSTTAAVWDV